MDIDRIRSFQQAAGNSEVGGAPGGLDNTHFGPSLNELRMIASTLSPILKARAIAKTCRALCLGVGKWKQQMSGGALVNESLAADDMLPMLMLVIIFGCVTESYGGSLRSLEAEVWESGGERENKYAYNCMNKEWDGVSTWMIFFFAFLIFPPRPKNKIKIKTEYITHEYVPYRELIWSVFFPNT
jgi:hypothetical protein